MSAKQIDLDKPPETLVERVLSRTIKQSDGCWVWSGASSRGYGQIGIGNQKLKYTHRIMYEAFKGTIPNDLVLDHLCRVPLCCNPDHLEPVTRHENSLRGMRAVRQFCDNGHEFSIENTIIRSEGGRRCRLCKRHRGKLYMRKKRSSNDSEKN